jgi:hypothetical protein
LAERFGSGDGERKTLLTRQIAFEPLPASVLFALGWLVCSVHLDLVYAGSLGNSILNSCAAPIDTLSSDPAIDEAAVVADLELVSLPGLDDVKILTSVDLAQHDVPYLKALRLHRLNGAELTGLNPSRHRVTPRPELCHLTSL